LTLLTQTVEVNTDYWPYQHKPWKLIQTLDLTNTKQTVEVKTHSWPHQHKPWKILQTLDLTNTHRGS